MAGITHPFLSGVSEGADPTLVGPNEWNQAHVVDSIAPSGLTGSTAASRYVGATTTGHPTTGAHLVGDWIVAQDGIRWTCIVAATPGTWVQEPGTGAAPASTVTGPDSFGDAAALGMGTNYARDDHDHGLPTPTVRNAAGVPSGAPTGTELPVAFDSTGVTGGLYFWDGGAWVKASTIP